MPRTKISEFSATPGDNTDIDGIDIAEGCAPSGINNAIREMMAQLKDFQTGSAGDPFNGAINGTVGATTPSTVVATQVDITAQGDLRLQDTTGGQYVALQAPGTIATSYTLTLPVDDGTAGQALITDGSGVLSWSSAASGDVYGPASATDNAVARFDSTTGKIIQNSAVTIGDDGATVIAANSSSDGLRITQVGTGNALLVEDSANPDATPFVVTGVGDVVQGYTVAVNNWNGAPDPIQSHSTSGNGRPSVGLYNWSSTTSRVPSFNLSKSLSNVVGTRGAVTYGMQIGRIAFAGDDGTSFVRAAEIDAVVDGTPGTNDMPGALRFGTTADGASSPTERMRIGSAGGVGIGTTSIIGCGLRVGKASDAASYVGVGSQGASNATVTNAYGFYSASSTSANAAVPYTITSIRHYDATQGVFNADSTVTTQYGFIANSTLTGATNNYGFYSNIASGTGRWNFYAAGTADNYFAGNVGIGTASPSALLHVSSGSAKIRIGLDASSQYTDIFRDNATGFTVYNAAQPSFSSHIFQIAGTEYARIGASGTISLGAAPGAESLRVTPVASAVNYLEVLGNITSNSPALLSSGSDTNLNMFFVSKGTGGFDYFTGGTSGVSGVVRQFRITHTASAVNYLQVTGGATGAFPVISALGADTNISLFYQTKGSGLHGFGTNNTTQFAIVNTNSAVNYAQVTGAATGNGVVFSAQGSDTNIDLTLTPKGTGVLRFGTYTAGVVTQAGYITIKDAGGTTRRLLVG